MKTRGGLVVGGSVFFGALAFVLVACGPDEPANTPAAVASTPPPPVSAVPPPPPAECKAGTMRSTEGGDCQAIVACKRDDAEADCESKCKAGDSASCLMLARRLSPTDPARAHHVAHIGCALGDMPSCEVAADTALRRTDVDEKVRRESAIKNYTRACPTVPVACEHLGRMYLKAEDKDLAKAQSSFEEACKGHATFCMALADFYLRYKSDGAKAVEAADRSCNGESAYPGYGCVEIGEYLEVGTVGLSKDPVKAFGYFEKGCDKGDAHACVALGHALHEGVGAKKDDAKARDAFVKSCKKGTNNKWGGWGCAWAGAAYEDGIGGPKDPVKASEIYGEACESNAAAFATSCAHEAMLLDKGAKGVTKDAAKAATLYETACTKMVGGSDVERALKKQSCDHLSADLEKKDKPKAVEMWQRDCEKGGDGHACARWKALGGAPPDEVWGRVTKHAEADCHRGSVEACKTWKELGGKPTADDLKQPETPWTRRPPTPESADAK